MSISIKHSFLNSIRFKLVVGLLFFLMPCLFLVAFNNFFTLNFVFKQVAESNKNVASLYLKQIDNSLADVDSYLADLITDNVDLSIIESTFDEDRYMLATARVFNYISKGMSIYKNIDGVFVYSIPKDTFIRASTGKVSNDQHSKVNNYIKSKLKSNPINNSMVTTDWNIEKIDNDFYLVHIFQNGDTFVGAWVTSSTLLIPLDGGRFISNSTSLFITGGGEPMHHKDLVRNNNIDLGKDIEQFYISGDKEKYIVVGTKSGKGNFSIAVLTPCNNITSGFPYMKQAVALIAVVTLIFLPLYLLILRKSVLAPLNKILSTMKRIRNGDMNIRIKPYKTSEEFDIVNNTFNDMLDQINKLKIDIYEEKINRQKAELEYLQLQVKPHFFLNSLNIMNTLARTNKIKLLQEMCACLIEYFRYMFRSNMSYVSLDEELKHVKNYIRIQEIRFPDRFSYEFDVPDYLLNLFIPPLLLHTFVENTVKHSVTSGSQVHLSIRICLEPGEEEPEVKIFIKDTGKGFKPEILDKLKSGEKIIDERGEHIGIRNIQQRLNILYNNKSVISFENGYPSGAVIKISIPFNQTLNGKEWFSEAADC